MSGEDPRFPITVIGHGEDEIVIRIIFRPQLRNYRFFQAVIEDFVFLDTKSLKATTYDGLFEKLKN